MEKPMKRPKLPGTDSIRKLAEFWDNHDLTDFEDELEEVAEPAFVRGSAITVPLGSREAEAVEKLAKAKGVSREELVRGWVLQNLPRRTAARGRTKR
jgi:CopG antitoxin of type II toxin-antitoxin system